MYAFEMVADGAWSCSDPTEFWKTSGEAGGCCATPCDICPASSVKADTVAGFWCEGDEGAFIGDSLPESVPDENVYLNTEVRVAPPRRRATHAATSRASPAT